jgi:hypothetical protein
LSDAIGNDAESRMCQCTTFIRNAATPSISLSVCDVIPARERERETEREKEREKERER